MGRILLFIGCLLIFSLAARPGAASEPPARPSLLMCADHYPPFSVYDMPGEPPRGSVVSVVQHLADTLGYELRFTANTPFRRCLRMLADGKADIMGGLLYSEERAQFLHLFRYLDHSTKSFYALKESDLQVNRLEDLDGLRVGVTLGHQYWPAFDAAEGRFIKSTASHVNDNFRRLLARRIDLVIATERQAMFLQASNPEYWGRFKKLAFSYTGENPVYIGLSKRSAAAQDHARFAEVSRQLLDDQVFEAISEKFYREYFGPTAGDVSDNAPVQ